MKPEEFRDLIEKICDYSARGYEDEVVVVTNLKYCAPHGFVREVYAKTPYDNVLVWNGRKFLVDTPRLCSYLKEVLVKLEADFLAVRAKEEEKESAALEYVMETWS